MCNATQCNAERQTHFIAATNFPYSLAWYRHAMTPHYVYLLIDPRNDSIFYVGQGVGTRAADHEAEALKWRADGYPPLEQLGEKTPDERSSKRLKILEILDSGHRLIVDFLRGDLTGTQADLVETVAIDLLGLNTLTNQVTGPSGSRRMRATLFEIMAKAETKTLHRAAVVVPTVGVRGTYNAHGGMLEADPATALENAESLWSVDLKIRETLAARAAAGNPTLLIGIQSGKSLPRARGLVVGVWEISGCEYDGPRVKRYYEGEGKDRVLVKTTESDGYRFVVKDEPSAELEALRKELTWHRLVNAEGKVVQTQPGAIYINWNASGEQG